MLLRSVQGRARGGYEQERCEDERAAVEPADARIPHDAENWTAPKQRARGWRIRSVLTIAGVWLSFALRFICGGMQKWTSAWKGGVAMVSADDVAAYILE